MLRQTLITKFTCILFIFMFKGSGLFAQEPAFDSVHITPDSVIVFRDSVLIPLSDTIILIESGTHYRIRKNHYNKSRNFYDSVYHKTHKKDITKKIYKLVLSYNPREDLKNAGEHKVAKNSFEEHAGKTISSIQFVKVDILEGSVQDTLKFAITGFGKALNKTHFHTHDRALQNHMLIEVGDLLEPGIIADNERILRNLPAIEDVRIVIVPDSTNVNRVDLLVITKDIFPVAFSASASSFEKFRAGLSHNNLFGLTHELGVKLMYDKDYKDPLGYELRNNYRNVAGSFINYSIIWIDAFYNEHLRLNASKGFLTPHTKYGGAVDFGWNRDRYEIETSDTTISGQYNSNYEDVWMGRSFLLGGQNSRKNLIFSARYRRVEFTEHPFISADSNLAFHGNSIYYGKIAYSKLNYYKVNMVRSYGISENIPFGFLSGLTFAYMDGTYLNRGYMGVHVAAAKYIDKFGYLTGNVISGGFYRKGQVSQGQFETNLYYHTPLLTINRYKYRQFIWIRYRKALTKDVERTFNFEGTIRNLDQEYIYGNSDLLIKTEMILFSPWYYYGFRFAPFLFADLGWISYGSDAFSGGSHYSALGLGFRIRNESLAFKNIIISFGYLPNTRSKQDKWFYDFSMGEGPLINIMSIQKPYILRREMIFPY